VARALQVAPRPRVQSLTAFLLGTSLAGAGALSLALDRTRPDADEVLREAWEVVRTQPAEGPILPETRARAQRLRQVVGAWPTEAKRRVAYAALLYAGARSLKDRSAAAFHAEAAAGLAPATAPVQSGAAVLLAGSGDLEGGLRCLRHLFEFSPGDAARTLLQLEPVLDPALLERALPDRPAAHLAWATLLRAEGERELASARIDLAWARWPDDLAVRRAAALRDRDRGDWAGAAAKLGAPDLPPDLLALRARARAETGDLQGARADLDLALASAEDEVDLLQLCGEAALSLDDVSRARALFEAALYRLPSEAPVAHRVRLLRRLAAAEERLGHAGAALRLWREVLALDGKDEAAGARVAALTGAR
jgi:tetratricopeptide (TPR) repeat protein